MCPSVDGLYALPSLERPTACSCIEGLRTINFLRPCPTPHLNVVIGFKEAFSIQSFRPLCYQENVLFYPFFLSFLTAVIRNL